MPSSPTLTTANRSSSRARKETVRFDPEADTAAEVKAAAAVAATAAAAAAGKITANNPTATTMSKKPSSVAKKKRKAATSAATVPSSSMAVKKKKKKTSSVVRKKSAPWTTAEDHRLRTIVAKEQRQRKDEAIRWIHVAETLCGSRTPKQVRERWLHVLDPNRKHGEWTEEETALVIRLQKELGNR